LQTYGHAFLAAIKAYCERTGLPTDVPMPRTAGTSLAARPPSTSSRPNAKKEQAFKLFRNGEVVTAVVHQTGLTRGTVTDYLAEFVLAEKPATIFGWVAEDVCERVAAAADLHGTARLKPVFLELNQEVSYDDIRVVFAYLDSRRA
jgi:ATP-dependent DNA helicase RecQ